MNNILSEEDEPGLLPILLILDRLLSLSEAFLNHGGQLFEIFGTESNLHFVNMMKKMQLWNVSATSYDPGYMPLQSKLLVVVLGLKRNF